MDVKHHVYLLTGRKNETISFFPFVLQSLVSTGWRKRTSLEKTLVSDDDEEDDGDNVNGVELMTI